MNTKSAPVRRPMEAILADVAKAMTRAFTDLDGMWSGNVAHWLDINILRTDRLHKSGTLDCVRNGPMVALIEDATEPNGRVKRQPEVEQQAVQELGALNERLIAERSDIVRQLDELARWVAGIPLRDPALERERRHQVAKAMSVTRPMGAFVDALTREKQAK